MQQISILYEDKDFLVINKPSGLVVHSDGKTDEPTLADWILGRAAEVSPEEVERMKLVGEPLKLSNSQTIFRPGIVHRLDRETSGVLLIAKNQPAYEHAKKQFQGRDVHKIYNAFVYGVMKAAVGEGGKIDRPIARSKNDFRKWTAQPGSRGEERQAVTEYTVLKKGSLGGDSGVSSASFSGASPNAGANADSFTYIEARPLTGRTHQIRVHLKAINHPVVCDKLYAPGRVCPLELGRLALHASSIEFTAMNGKNVQMSAPLPEEFDRILEKIS